MDNSNSRGGRNKRRGRGYGNNQSRSPRGRGSDSSPAGGQAEQQGSSPSAAPAAAAATPVKEPEVKVTTNTPVMSTPESASKAGGAEEQVVASPKVEEEAIRVENVGTPQTAAVETEAVSPDPEFVTPTSSPIRSTTKVPESEKPHSVEVITPVVVPAQPPQVETPKEQTKTPGSEAESTPSVLDPMVAFMNTPGAFSVTSSELTDPDEALPDLEPVEPVKRAASPPPAPEPEPAKQENKKSEAERKQQAAEDSEKVEVVPVRKTSNVQGKPGYLGGVVGLGGSTNTGDGGGDGYDSDDSLLTPSRRPSTANGGTGWMGFSRRQVLTLLVFSLADFFSAIIISLQAPFYPQEAEAKGATATQYGLVFGVFELVVFVTSPIYGKYLYKLGPKLVFNTGICVTGIATILFGFLDRFDDGPTFIALSFVVRIIEALGDAAFITASFAIIAAEFPESVATTFASLETFFGLGLIVGPTLGGALYQRGGFTLPFAVMGGLLLVVAVLTFLLMPKHKPMEESEKESPGGLIAILKVPGVALAAVAIITGSITIGFLNSTLEPHIRQFALNPVLTGLVFIINGGMYALTAPAWGWLCDRIIQPIYAGLIGAVTIFIGFLFIGPVIFLPMDTVLWLTCVGLMVHGVGLGATLVSSFVMALRESINHGFADNIQTYGLTSALWTSSFALGSFIGPSMGGILLDQVGFRWATVFVLSVQVVLMLLIMGYIAKSRSTSGSSSFGKGNLSEHAPLLGAVSEDPCTSKTAIARQGNGNGNGGGSKNGAYGATGATLA